MTDAGRAQGSRYAAIDVLRGLALVSMISSHMENFRVSTIVGRALHSAHWIDGAFFFIALSGLVTGLVHRRIVERSGVRASASKLVRRAGFLYLVHIALALAIITTFSADPGAAMLATPTWAQAGGIGHAVQRILDLSLEPNFNTVLPLYVVLLLWTVAAVALLRRGAWWAVAAISVAVYAVGQVTGGMAFSEGGFPIADWQLLFTAGLLVGWGWEHERALVSTRWRRGIVWTAVVVASAFYVAARLLQRPAELAFGAALQKDNGGWLAFLFAGAVLVTGYVLVDHARGVRGVTRAIRPFEVLGARGLPGYVAMVLSLLVLDVVPGLPRNDLTIVAIAGVCALAEYGSTRRAMWRPQPAMRAVPAAAPAGGTS